MSLHAHDHTLALAILSNFSNVDGSCDHMCPTLICSSRSLPLRAHIRHGPLSCTHSTHPSHRPPHPNAPCHPPTHPPIHPSTRPSTHTPTRPPIHLPIRPHTPTRPPRPAITAEKHALRGQSSSGVWTRRRAAVR